MRRCFKTLSLILALLMLAGAFAGCGDQPGTAGESTKDSLVFSINADIVTTDCHMARDTVTGIVHYQIYETLVRDQPGEGLVPALAESWEFSADNTEITFKLRENVKFHNGDTMTAEDVAFSLNRAIASSFTASYSGTMDHAEVVDDTHVKLCMKQAFGPVLQCLSVPCLGIVSKRAVEELGDEGFAAAPVGTGPYKFVEWSSGEKIVLEAFDEYWRGAPTIKDLTFMIMTDRNTAAIALENNEVDVLYSPDLADREHLESLENVQFIAGDGSVYMWVIAFNNESEIFSDKRVREAISYAINRDEIVDGALNGFGEAVEMPIVPSVFGYDPEFKGHEYDLEKAKQLMAEAGYADGLTVTIKLNQSSTYTRPAEIVQAQLRQIGSILSLSSWSVQRSSQTLRPMQIMTSHCSCLLPDIRMLTTCSTAVCTAATSAAPTTLNTAIPKWMHCLTRPAPPATKQSASPCITRSANMCATMSHSFL